MRQYANRRRAMSMAAPAAPAPAAIQAAVVPAPVCARAGRLALEEPP